jgi:hypothetical protein
MISTILGRNTNDALTKNGRLLNQTKPRECGLSRFRSGARTLTIAFLNGEFEEGSEIKGWSGVKGATLGSNKLGNPNPHLTFRRTLCGKQVRQCDGSFCKIAFVEDPHLQVGILAIRSHRTGTPSSFAVDCSETPTFPANVMIRSAPTLSITS